MEWKDLPSTVQAALLKQMTRQTTREGTEASDNGAILWIVRSIKPDKDVDVSENVETAFELPGTGIMSFREYRVNASYSEPSGFQSSPAKLVLSEGVRGVLCAPKTADEARKTVDMLPDLGLNTLFLDVFSNGRTYFANKGIPPETKQAGDVLPAALDEAATKHIAVYAVVDTLCWRKDGESSRPAPWPAGFDESLNVFGEPSGMGVQRRIRQHAVRTYGSDSAQIVEDGAGSCGWADPQDTSVRKVLPALIQDLAAVPGLARLVFQDTAPPGYFGLPDNEGISLGLGYTLSIRLALPYAFTTFCTLPLR